MTYHDQHEYLVMSCCVTNTLEVFMNYMNKNLHPYLDSFVAVFVEYILVYYLSKE